MPTDFPTDPKQLFASSDFASSQGIGTLVVGNTLYLAMVAGNRTTDIASFDGTTWTGPTSLFGDWATPQSISLAYFKNKYYATVVHTDDRVYQSVSPDGVTWPCPSQLFKDKDFATPQSVAMVATASKLYLAIVSGDNRTYIANFDGTTWTDPAQIFGDWATPQAMTLSYFQNYFHLAVVRHDNRIYHAVSPDGVTWPETPTQLFESQDFATPQAINALTTSTNMYYAIVSGDNRVHVASFDGSAWTGPTQVLDDWGTPEAVAINYFQGNFYLTLLSHDYRVYQAFGSPLPIKNLDS